MTSFQPGDRVKIHGPAGHRLTDQTGTVKTLTPILNIYLVAMDDGRLNTGYGTVPIRATHLEKIEREP
jgi:hypothetical protein